MYDLYLDHPLVFEFVGALLARLISFNNNNNDAQNDKNITTPMRLEVVFKSFLSIESFTDNNKAVKLVRYLLRGLVDMQVCDVCVCVYVCVCACVYYYYYQDCL